MEKYNGVHQNKKEMMWNNFLGGMAWALGAVIGTAIILGLLTLLSSQINLIPIVGGFISDIIDFVLKNNRSLQ